LSFVLARTVKPDAEKDGGTVLLNRPAGRILQP